MSQQQPEFEESPQEHKGGLESIYGAPEGYDALVIARKALELAKQGGIHVHAALDDRRTETLRKTLSFFHPDIDIVTFPAWDCLPYDRVSPHPSIVSERIEALSAIINWRKDQKNIPRIVLTTLNAITQRVVPQKTLLSQKLDIYVQETLDYELLLDFLVSNGYIRTDTVREPGEYAIRGSIIDLFPAGRENPVRLDLFGDEIESLKTFDALSQRSIEEIKGFSVLPAAEFEMGEESRRRFRAAYREYFGPASQEDSLYQAVSEGRRYNGMEHWLPLFHDKMETIFDYLPQSRVTLDLHCQNALKERQDQIADFYQARKALEKPGQKSANKPKDVSLAGSVYHPLPPNSLYLTHDECMEALQENNAAYLSPFGKPEHIEGEDAKGRKGRDFADIRSKPDGDVIGALNTHLIWLQSTGAKTLIAAYSDGSASRMKELFEKNGIEGLKLCHDASAVKSLKTGQSGIITLPLENGFEAPDICLLTEGDILGDRITQKTRKRKKADQFLTEVSSLNPGDLVVHIDHGIGRFEKLETLKAAGTLHDCLQITYQGGDRLFVPVENIEVLSRFGSEEGGVTLDKMGGAGWQARKAKVKKDLMAMAGNLLDIAAKRELKPAQKVSVSDEIYGEFVTRFPFNETEDQSRAIEDVISDLEAGRPMDRLVCGDVGFGKTEVALRAAYIAAMNGLQVAVIVPTTLLARQHTLTFQKRFQGLGLQTAQLSRMVSQKEAKSVKQGLANGEINIVVGTHALLGKNVSFDNLGLVIVDEEQRFGVKQKEKLKELRADVHVLTLTATPIPRTLQLSLTGVKELSLIASPPVDRLAVRTFILPYDPVVIREAILREHYRGGQSFYVCPRIKDLENVEQALKELVPEVKCVTAHGQMPARELEDKMNAFYDGQYGLLLATNIIESGLDIPSANTMIVHKADMFGLSQLYQIRGRIGRSKTRAYAYLTYQPDKSLGENAQKRLEVMETLDSLGAGFQLASYDMDIRGAGNLLGEEQSGHIKEVGIELYQQMLEEAVAQTRAGQGVEGPEIIESQNWSPQINLGTSVLIPEEYVPDLNVRMSLYRRLGSLGNENDIESFAAELIDRFGEIPAEVQNLLDIVEIKNLCMKAGVDKIEAGPKGALVRFYKDAPPNLQGLVKWMDEKGAAIKLRPDQQLVAIRQWDRVEQRVKGVRSLAGELAALAG